MDTSGSPSNVSRVNQTVARTRFPRGTNKELIKIENAKLWFIGGRDINRVIGIVKEGDFSIRMVVQTASPAMMTKCIVGDIEWPITRDSPVLRVGARSFVFAMPGLLYGLQLAPKCPEEIFEALERIFMRFCCYQNHVRKIFGAEDHPYFWPLSQWAIESITQPFLKRVGAFWKRDEGQIFNMNDRVLRIQQMSFVVKLITKGLLVGKINPTQHVEVIGREALNDGDEVDSRATPTMFLFSDLVEAMEESKVLMNMQYHLIAPYEPRWIPVPNIAFWNINKRGLLLMLSVIKSAVFLNFEVTMHAFLGQNYQRFLVPAVRMVEPGENSATAAAQEEEERNRNPRREIRFPILNEVAETSNQESNNSLVEQLELGRANLEMQKLKEKQEPF
ncbi:hypothetical protein AQUCO_01400534v1 [Aquilegia coerulea]|uniref:Uncharacterized protein n=1 Tax=Aquilegia coerulea TaxID=218851 RepID=A0A2G5DXN2_AQUCA|nr:hypothetical protein AQUCO_01400534v1 [Aquilegia coerulea]